MIDIEPLDAAIIIVLYFISTTINAYFCYLVWRKRAVKDPMIKTFDTLLSKTQVGKSLITISGAIEKVEAKIVQINAAVDKFNGLKVDEDSIVGKIWRRFRGQAGGNQAALNSEVRELEGDVASVVEQTYPGCMWMADNLDLLVDVGLIDQTKADAFTRAAKHPTVLPTLEKASLFLKKKFDSLTGATASTGGGNTGRPKF